MFTGRLAVENRIPLLLDGRYSLEQPTSLRPRVDETVGDRLRRLETPGDDTIFLFGCDHALQVEPLAADNLAVVSLPCTGLLPPSFADFIARKPGVAGVMISGCHPDDCFCRKGSEWTEQRFKGERMPHLRTKAGKTKVRVSWAGPRERASLLDEINTFRRDLG